jgi:hypothetical protein
MTDFVTFVKRAVQHVIRNISESDSVEVIGCGSSFEGTNNGLPDELDFLVIFLSASFVNRMGQGYGKMIRDELNAKRRSTIGSYGMWLWKKLRSYWGDCQRKSQSTLEENGRRFQLNLQPMLHPDRTSCSTWAWLYSDGMFNNFTVSIDLLPAIATDIPPMWRSKSKVKVAPPGRPFHIVPKIPHEGSSVL